MNMDNLKWNYTGTDNTAAMFNINRKSGAQNLYNNKENIIYDI
jgi:hypothetical protein